MFEHCYPKGIYTTKISLDCFGERTQNTSRLGSGTRKYMGKKPSTVHNVFKTSIQRSWLSNNVVSTLFLARNGFDNIWFWFTSCVKFHENIKQKDCIDSIGIVKLNRRYPWNLPAFSVSDSSSSSSSLPCWQGLVSTHLQTWTSAR